MGKRGGRHQQRGQQAHAADGENVAGVDHLSPLGRLLLNKWAWGKMSAVLLQELAHAAKMSGLQAADVGWMASLGSHGHSPNNINKQLMRKFVERSIAPQPFLAMPYFKVKRKSMVSVAREECPLLLPHDWLSSLAQHGLLEQVLGIQRAGGFWSQSDATDPKWFQNPYATIPVEDRNKIVPILLHGDGGAFQKRDSLMIYSFRSMLMDTAVQESQLLICAVPKSSAIKDTTFKDIWAILTWSFKALWAGKHPDADHRGNPFPAGSYRSTVAGNSLDPIFKTKAMVYSISGDMEFFANDMGLKHFGSNEPCFKCACNCDDAPWNDFRPTATWRSRVYTPLQNRGSPPTQHPVMSIPCVVAETFAIDVMHVVDLGIALHLVGNVLFELMYESKWNMDRIWARVLEIYCDLDIEAGHRITKLAKASFADLSTPHQKYPCLKGIKAREARYLVPVAWKLCEEIEMTAGAVGDSAYKAHKTRCCKALLDFYSTIDGAGWYLQPDSQRKCRASMDAFLQHYNWLAKAAFNKGLRRWSLVPKFHFAAHVPDSACYINPRKTWAYGGESMVGLVANLGNACMRGCPTVRVASSIVAKYRVGMHVSLTHPLA